VSGRRRISLSVLLVAGWAAAATGDVLPFVVEDGTFKEQIGQSGSAPKVEGSDLALAEYVSTPWIFDFGPDLTMFFDGTASANEVGPQALAQASAYSVFGPPGDASEVYGSFDWTSLVEITYHVAVYNLVDLGGPVTVPLTGRVRARARVLGEGQTRADTIATFWMLLEPTLSPYVFQRTGACYPQTDTCPAYDFDDYALTLDVPLGAGQYDHRFVEARVWARARINPVAYRSFETVLSSGTATAFAWIDPVFEIDPAFPDADKIGIEVSANVEPALVPEPGRLPLAAAALLGVAGSAWCRRGSRAQGSEA
jgi:hypothetical protein